MSVVWLISFHSLIQFASSPSHRPARKLIPGAGMPKQSFAILPGGVIDSGIATPQRAATFVVGSKIYRSYLKVYRET